MLAIGNGNNFGRTLYAFGDSHTQGSGSNPDPIKLWGYVNYVVQCVGWRLENYAVGGTKIEDSAHTVNMAIIRPTARRDRILWMTGYNDYKFYGNDATEINNYGTRLQAALTTLSTYNVPIILGNVKRMKAEYYSLGAPTYDKGSDAAAAAYSAKIATVAEGFPLVTIVDVNTLFNTQDVHLQGDHVHLNYYGTIILGQIFVNSIIANGFK